MSIHPYTRLGRGNDLAELESSPHGFTLDPDVLQTVAMASFEAAFRLNDCQGMMKLTCRMDKVHGLLIATICSAIAIWF